MTAARALALALLLWAADASAQATCPPPAPAPTAAELQAAAQQARSRGALWRYARDGRHGYLYGTLHVGKLEWAVPGGVVARSLQDSAVIAIEADLLDPNFQSTMTAPRNAGDPRLPEALLARLRTQSTRLCASWEQMRALPPMMIVTTLTLLDARREGLYADYATELVLAGFAKATGKELVALETAATQRGALTGGTPAEQRAAVDAWIASVESGIMRRDLLATAQAWVTGDLEGLSASLAKLGAGERATIDRAVFARNPALADRIAELHSSGRTLFATAGILHMIGDAGLPALLSARGFTVERVAFEDR